MYFEAAKWGKNSFARYFIGFLITFIGYALLGSLPLMMVMIASPNGMEAMEGGTIDPVKLARIAGSKNAAFLLLTTIFVITMMCFWFAVQFVHKKRMKWIATGAKNYRWDMFWFAFAIGAIAIIASVAIAYFSGPDELLFRFNARSFAILCLIAAVMIPIQAGWEELFFRGYLMQGLGLLKLKSYVFFLISAGVGFMLYKALQLKFEALDLYGMNELLGFDLLLVKIVLVTVIILFQLLKSIFERAFPEENQGIMNKNWPVFPLIITTLLFAAVHMANPEVMEHGVKVMFPMYAIMGLSFGLMVIFSDGLELAMGYHIANNFWLSLLMTSPESVLQTDSLFYTTEVQDMSGEVWTLLFFNVLILAIFAWRYKWFNNWREKLFGPIT